MSRRRFRLGSDEVVLVPRRDLIALDDPERAAAFVRRLDERERLELQSLLGVRDDLANDDELAHALVARGLLLVRIDDAPRRLDEPSVRPLLVEPSLPSTTTHVLALEVVHETGGAFAGARFVVDLPSGERVDGQLDARSRWSHDGLSSAGACGIRFETALQLTEEQQRRPSTPACTLRPEDLTARVGTVPELSLRPDRAQRLIVQLPPPIPVVRLAAGTFVLGEAFPTPAVAPALDAVVDALQHTPDLRVSAMAHADVATDPVRDKLLSDRRAEALVAVLTNDTEAFARIGSEEAWSLRHDQAMLRMLGCNPAAIDGVDGPLTQRATRWFQAEHSRGVHHPDGLARPLAETGVLDAATRKALREAYLLALSPQLAPDQLAGPGAMGCGSFNLPAGGAADQGREQGAIGLWPRAATGDVEFPCRTADPGACRIDNRGERRCRFHRETFDLRHRTDAPVFFDFDWIELPSGTLNLSAITSLPDGTRVRVHVFADVQDYDGRVRLHHGPTPLPQRGTLMGAPVDGIVRYGVCVAKWARPNGWDPFDWPAWLTDVAARDEHEEAPEALAGPYFHPPLFGIEYEGGWAFSRPPGERIDRFAVHEVSRSGLAMANDGSFVAFHTAEDRVVTQHERRADEHVMIVGWCTQGQSLCEEGGS